MFAIYACSGGGCGAGGCAECGIGPIPMGFPANQRIQNAIALRLSSGGISFLEQNINEIVAATQGMTGSGLTIPIPSTDVGGGITLCPAGNCNVEIIIENIDLTPTPPSSLAARVDIRLRSVNATGGNASIPINGIPVIGNCTIGINTMAGSRPTIGANATVAFNNETAPARAGLTTIAVSGVGLAMGQGIENQDVSIGGGGLCAVASVALPLIIPILEGQITSFIQPLLDTGLCTTRGMTGCPAGTFDRGETAEDAICYLSATPPGGGMPDRCVPIMLGLEGRADFGQLALGSISPGTLAPSQLLLAVGGAGRAVNNGMSLSMTGGFMSMTRDYSASPGHSTCVPVTTPPALPTIMTPMAFDGNTIPGTMQDYQLGIGISESYLEHTMWNLWDSGFLCIGIGDLASLAPELASFLPTVYGLLGINPLIFPDDAAQTALAIVLRPQNAPEINVGTQMGEPLLAITLTDAAIDMYAWISGAYVRIATATTDLTLELDLTVANGEIAPQIQTVMLSGTTITNNELVPTAGSLGPALEGIINSMASAFTDAIPPIAIPPTMGIAINIPNGGIRGVNSNGEDYLGLFVNIAVAPPLLSIPETTLSVAQLELDRESMALETWDTGPGNAVWLELGTEAQSGEYEFSYRVDRGRWSEWTTERHVRLADDVLLFQGRHRVEARARIIGDQNGVDPTPAEQELLVDIIEPAVELRPQGEGEIVTRFEVHARDLVSPASALRYRYRVRSGEGGLGEWSDWSSIPAVELDALTLDGGSVEVEVSDEVGNIGRATMPLIRGIPNPMPTGPTIPGCDSGCRVAGAGSDRSAPVAVLGLLGLLSVIAIRRRRALSLRKAAAVAGTSVAILFAGGCDCGGATIGGMTDANVRVDGTLPDGGTPPDTGPDYDAGPENDVGPPPPDTGPSACNPACTGNNLCCLSTFACTAFDPATLCQPGFMCPMANRTIDSSCTVSCSMCMPLPALMPGTTRDDLDAVVSSGDVYVSGYNAGTMANRYGDLVFGRWDSAMMAVDWETVDGAPAGPITNDPGGWRGGVSAPGDDVGHFTSLAVSNGTFYIAYYDATNGALKIAIGAPGGPWNVHTIDDVADSGRYPSIVLAADGTPAIAYLRIDTAGMESAVELAVASGPMPAAMGDWTITEIANAPIMTAAGLPEAVYGVDAQLARTSSGWAAAWYDRTTGNVWGATGNASGSTWSAPFLIDGWQRAAPDTADSGQYLSLVVDGMDRWHLAYANYYYFGMVRYASITNASMPSRMITYEDVDDGSECVGTSVTCVPGVGMMMRFPEGTNAMVGAFSSIAVTGSGEVRIAYMDATHHTVRLATRGAMGAWTLSVVDEGANEVGWWIEQVLDGDTSEIVYASRAGNSGSVFVTSP